MTDPDPSACVRACGPIGTEDGVQAMNGARANTAQHSAQELHERAAAAFMELGRVHQELARLAEIRLAIRANPSDITLVNATDEQRAKDTMASETMLSVNDLAEFLAVDAKTVRRWRSDGHLPPALEIGGVVRWSPARVRRWISEVSK